MENLLTLYGFLKRDKRKERFDIILEPLQTMTQLALLAFCPKGSKLSIANNLVVIQTPTWMQGMLRTYNHDKKDDVFFLFNAIMRFGRFYKNLSTDLRSLILKLSKLGLDNMLETYSNVDQPALLHALQLYRTILDKPSLFQDDANDSDLEDNGGGNPNSVLDIDAVFIKITYLYTDCELRILYNTLVLMELYPEHYEIYMQGINAIMTPLHFKIKKWIADNIVY
jgi:hypothetical protein